MNLQAFHSFWSKPNTIRNQGMIEYPDFEVLTTILSALKWKEHNGTIDMVTDSCGAEYFRKIGIDGIWDHLDTSLDEIDESVDPMYFWAAGKLFALSQRELPTVMLDTDLIIWETLERMERDADIVAAHYEELYPEVYPDPKGFHLLDGYTYPKEWDQQVFAANTAFLYMKNEKFRDYYVNSAVSFLKHVDFAGLNPVTAMCFAEQRILPMCAKAKHEKIGYLIDIHDPDAQRIATHTWGFKDVMRRSSQARDEFCLRCVNRILSDYPEKESLLTGRADLRRYLDAVKREKQ